MLHCDCPTFCKGGKEVTQKTHQDHARYRTSKLSAAFNEFIANETASRLGTRHPHTAASGSTSTIHTAAPTSSPEKGPHRKRRREGDDNAMQDDLMDVDSDSDVSTL